MNLTRFTLFLLVCLAIAACRKRKKFYKSHVDKETKCIKYLRRYGYLKDIDEKKPWKVRAALKRFQKVAHIKDTGDISEETENAMNQPRCGMPDTPLVDDDNDTNIRRKRYLLQGSRWLRRHISYKIIAYSNTSSLTHAQQDAAMRAAFDYWSAVTSLTFTPVTCEPVDIAIAFAKGAHPQFLNDRVPFDGPGSVLAHAYYPTCMRGKTVESLCGDAHFDDDETWITDFLPGQRHLTKIAVHEFGHSLGLAHSGDTSAVMYPFYRNIAPIGPQADDIAGIRAIYKDENTVYSVPGIVDEVPTCPTTTTTLSTSTTTTTPTTTSTIPITTTTTTTPTTKSHTTNTTTTTPTTTKIIPTTTTKPSSSATTPCKPEITSRPQPTLGPKYCPYREHRICRRRRSRRRLKYLCKKRYPMALRLCPYTCRVCKRSERLKCADDPRCHHSGRCVFMGIQPSKQLCASRAYNYGRDKRFCTRGKKARQGWKCWHCDNIMRAARLCPQMCSRCPP